MRLKIVLAALFFVAGFVLSGDLTQLHSGNTPVFVQNTSLKFRVGGRTSGGMLQDAQYIGTYTIRTNVYAWKQWWGSGFLVEVRKEDDGQKKEFFIPYYDVTERGILQGTFDLFDGLKMKYRWIPRYMYEASWGSGWSCPGYYKYYDFQFVIYDPSNLDSNTVIAAYKEIKDVPTASGVVEKEFKFKIYRNPYVMRVGTLPDELLPGATFSFVELFTQQLSPASSLDALRVHFKGIIDWEVVPCRSW